MTRIAVRGFIRGVRQFEEQLDADAVDVEKLAEHHATRLLALPGGEFHMIEIEFLDEEDPLTRFFRFGSAQNRQAWFSRLLFLIDKAHERKKAV